MSIYGIRDTLLLEEFIEKVQTHCLILQTHLMQVTFSIVTLSCCVNSTLHSPCPGIWQIKVMKDHFEDFVKFYKSLGDPRESWIQKEVIKEKSIARIHTKIDHVGEKPTYNKVCCCKLEQKQSKKEIEWVVVQQRWHRDELSIHGEEHRIGQPKRVWEVCGSHLGSYSYFMYLNPTYELAFEGVAAELNMDLGGEMLSKSLSSTFHHSPVKRLDSSSLDPMPALAEEEHEDDADLPSKNADVKEDEYII